MKLGRSAAFAWASVVLLVAAAAGWALWRSQAPQPAHAALADADPARIRAGEAIYRQHCASCHGADLEGERDWRQRKPSGRLPAPPHDDSGHTWHHPDEVLFGITKFGLVPSYAPADYPSDMPAFGGALSDEEIRAVLAFIESRWSDEVRETRRRMTRR